MFDETFAEELHDVFLDDLIGCEHVALEQWRRRGLLARARDSLQTSYRNGRRLVSRRQGPSVDLGIYVRHAQGPFTEESDLRVGLERHRDDVAIDSLV